MRRAPLLDASVFQMDNMSATKTIILPFTWLRMNPLMNLYFKDTKMTTIGSSAAVVCLELKYDKTVEEGHDKHEI